MNENAINSVRSVDYLLFCKYTLLFLHSILYIWKKIASLFTPLNSKNHTNNYLYYAKTTKKVKNCKNFNVIYTTEIVHQSIILGISILIWKTIHL